MKRMRNYTPLVLALLAIVGAAITQILNANGMFAGKTWLLPYLYTVWVALFSLAILSIWRGGGTRPVIVPLRYGEKPGYFKGLFFANDSDDIAYDVRVANIPLGKAQVQFQYANFPRIAKNDGEQFSQLWIERKTGSGTAGALYEEMRNNDIEFVRIPIYYRDERRRKYVTLCKLEIDVMAPGGLRVSFRAKRLLLPRRD